MVCLALTLYIISGDNYSQKLVTIDKTPLADLQGRY